METVLLVIPLVVTLVVGAILFLIREKRFAPWIWVPASAWGLGHCLKLLLGVFMMRNTRPEPKEGLWLGFDPLALYAVLCAGLVGLVVWLGFPRKTTWRDKSWAGGVLVLIGVPLLREGLKVLSGAGSGSGSIWLIALLAAGVPALFVAVLLFLLRKRSVAPWIWVPVVGWSAWAGLSLLPTVLPRDPRYGPPQWSYFGYDAILVLCALIFCGAVVIGALVGFPQRSIWSIKSWLGGVVVALALPLAGWLLFTTPFTLQLVGPDGKPVAGAVVYRLKPGLGSRLPAVSDKTSDADGMVVYRSFPHTDIKLLVPGNSSWATTELSIGTPREGYSKWEFRNFRQLYQSWGDELSTEFNQALRRASPAARRFPDPAVRGRVGWMARGGQADSPIPVFLHSSSRPIHSGLLELLRAQLKDTGLAAQFPSFVQEIAYGQYGFLLGQEIRELHIRALNTDAQLELIVREALFTQAGMLADSLNLFDRSQQSSGVGRDIINSDIRLKIGGAVGTPSGADAEHELSQARATVNEAARVLLEHIRAHPGNSGRSLADFESLLAKHGF